MIVLMKAPFNDCPTCDGVGYEYTMLEKFTTLEECLKNIQDEAESFLCLRIYNENLDPIFEIDYKMGFHRVHKITLTNVKTQKNITLNRKGEAWEYVYEA